MVLVAALELADGYQVSIDQVFGHEQAPMFGVLIAAASAGAVRGWLGLRRIRHREAD